MFRATSALFVFLGLASAGLAAGGATGLSPALVQRFDEIAAGDPYYELSSVELALGLVLVADDRVREGWEILGVGTIGETSDERYADRQAAVDELLGDAHRAMAFADLLLERGDSIPAEVQGPTLEARASVKSLLGDLQEISRLGKGDLKAVAALGTYATLRREPHRELVFSAKKSFPGGSRLRSMGEGILGDLAPRPREVSPRTTPTTRARTAPEEQAPTISDEEYSREKRDYEEWLAERRRQESERARLENDLARKKREQLEDRPDLRLEDGAASVGALERHQDHMLEFELDLEREAEVRERMRTWYDAVYLTQAVAAKNALRDVVQQSKKDPNRSFRRCADLARLSTSVEGLLPSCPLPATRQALESLYSALASLGLRCAEGEDPLPAVRQLQPILQAAADSLAPFGLSP